MSGDVDFYGLLEFVSQVAFKCAIVCLVLPVPIVRRTAALGLAPSAKFSKKPLRMALSLDCASIGSNKLWAFHLARTCNKYRSV